ncbi:MAG: metallophosphoesterase [Pseudomonadota bacterium]
MKRILCLLSIAVTIALAASSYAESKAMKETLARLSAVRGPFMFTAMGDNRSGDRVYKKIMDRLEARKPLFVINTGDIIPNPGNRDEWSHFWELSKPITAPYFLTAGNHDIDDAKSEKIWQEEVDLPGNELYYSFAVGKNLFVVLDSVEPKDDRKIAGKQFEWLRGVLDPGRYEHQFVFLHHPLFVPEHLTHSGESLDRYPEDRDRLHDLFVAKKVTAVFAGHVHTFNHIEKDGVAYIITGGAGAPLYGRESFNNLMFVDVDGPRIEAKVIDRDGVMRDEFLIGNRR